MFNYPIILTLPTGETINCKEVPVPNTSYSKLVKSDNSVAVLFCPNHGAGWSTYYPSSAAKNQLVFDSRIVQAVLSYEFYTNTQSVYEKCMKYISQFPWTQEPYLNNVPFITTFSGLQVQFIPKHTMFRMFRNEYNGGESIELFHSSKYMVT
jgi:hypothetical protein